MLSNEFVNRIFFRSIDNDLENAIENFDSFPSRVANRLQKLAYRGHFETNCIQIVTNARDYFGQCL